MEIWMVKIKKIEMDYKWQDVPCVAPLKLAHTSETSISAKTHTKVMIYHITHALIGCLTV